MPGLNSNILGKINGGNPPEYDDDFVTVLLHSNRVLVPHLSGSGCGHVLLYEYREATIDSIGAALQNQA